jgi:hypothetical protein
MPHNGDFDEEAAIGNFWTDAIYPRDFKDRSGKFLNIVTEDDGNTTVEYHPPHPSRNRIKLSVTFLRTRGDIKEVTLKKFKQYTTRGASRWEEQHWGPHDPMTFTYFTFEKLLGFLKLLTELDLVKLDQRRIALREDVGGRLDAETQAKMRALLKQTDGLAIVDELLRSGSITSRDLVNIGYAPTIDRFFALSADDKERFLRAGYWFQHASRVFRLSKSASFVALVSAIEALMPSSQASTKQQFVDFVEALVPGNSIPEAERKRFYQVRSALSHGGKLLASDHAGWGLQFTPKHLGEGRDTRVVSQIVQLVLHNWLATR